MDVFGPANTDPGELRVLNEELAARLRQVIAAAALKAMIQVTGKPSWFPVEPCQVNTE